MKSIKSLSIPEKAILYAYYAPLDVVARELFDVDEAKLLVIKSLAEEKFSPKTVSIDPTLYEAEFASAGKGLQAPRTATRKKRPRGRPGLNIIKAFSLIPSKPVPAEVFARQHNISMSVLRQIKRFDTTDMDGKVFVRKDPTTDQLMVWRQSSDVKA